MYCNLLRSYTIISTNHVQVGHECNTQWKSLLPWLVNRSIRIPPSVYPPIRLFPSGSLWEFLGSLWEPLRALGSLWEPLGTFGGHWELLGVSAKPSGLLGAPVGLLELLRVPGSLCEHPGASWELLGASWDPLGASRGPWEPL